MFMISHNMSLSIKWTNSQGLLSFFIGITGAAKNEE